MAPFQDPFRTLEEWHNIKYKSFEIISMELYPKQIIIASPSTDSESKHLKFKNHRKFIYKQKYANNKQYPKV